MSASPSPLAAAPKTKHDTAVELTLGSAEAGFKRQGTPGQQNGDMSHYVAEADSWSVEGKGLAGDGGMLSTSPEEESATQAQSCLSETMERRDHCGHGPPWIL